MRGRHQGNFSSNPPPPQKNCLLNLVEHQHYFWSLVNIKEQGEEISFCDPKPKWHKGGDMGFVGAHNDHQGRLRRTMRVFLVSKVEGDYIWCFGSSCSLFVGFQVFLFAFCQVWWLLMFLMEDLLLSYEAERDMHGDGPMFVVEFK